VFHASDVHVTVVEPPELTNHDLDDFLPAERH
jgi:hypothetical protein